MIISMTASDWPGWPAGTRLPYPVVVRVVKLKKTSWLIVPTPPEPKNGADCKAPRKR